MVASNPAIEKAQAGESTPDASNHSRSSSKKSNHSIHSVHNGKWNVCLSLVVQNQSCCYLMERLNFNFILYAKALPVFAEKNFQLKM